MDVEEENVSKELIKMVVEFETGGPSHQPFDFFHQDFLCEFLKEFVEGSDK